MTTTRMNLLLVSARISGLQLGLAEQSPRIVSGRCINDYDKNEPTVSVS